MRIRLRMRLVRWCKVLAFEQVRKADLKFGLESKKRFT